MAGAYGWGDLDLDHGFWDTGQGRRFIIGPTARAEVLDRLLELNHQRYAEEVAAGLHPKKAKRPASREPGTLCSPGQWYFNQVLRALLPRLYWAGIRLFAVRTEDSCRVT